MFTVAEKLAGIAQKFLEKKSFQKQLLENTSISHTDFKNLEYDVRRFSDEVGQKYPSHILQW